MESNGLPISIRTSPANQHDSTKFIDVLENISDFLNDDLIHAIISAYELQSDMRGFVIIILDLFTWHQF